MRFYNRVLSDTEIKNYHNQFASKVVLYEDFSQYPIGATKFGNWNSRTKGYILPNSFIVKEVTSIIPNLQRGTKYIYNNTSNTCSYSIPSNINYGTWTFVLIKSDSGANYFFEFCNDYNRTGYSLWWNIGTGVIKLYKGGTLAQSNKTYSTGYLNIKITRTTIGLITVNINNNDIFSVIDNTFTSCKSINLISTSAIGNGLANLKITQGVIV
jgi:hypothetical protein